MTREELNALTLQLNTEAALFMAPKIDEIDSLLGEAFSDTWINRYRALMADLPDGDVKMQLSNLLGVIEHMPAFLSNQRSVIKPFLPKTDA